jgi:hypothetical protein
MSSRAKVLLIQCAQLERLLSGAFSGLVNFPGDGVITAVQHVKDDNGEPSIAFRVVSETYPAVASGELLPVVRAVTSTRRG